MRNEHFERWRQAERAAQAAARARFPADADKADVLRQRAHALRAEADRLLSAVQESARFLPWRGPALKPD